MSQIYSKSGGYRKLHSFNLACIIHLGTKRFCRRFINWKEDPLGKTSGQMIGAARSGKQNLVEGSERARTSAETEIKLTDVAKASLAELQGDFEDYIGEGGQAPWSVHSDDYKAVSGTMLDQFQYTDDVLHDHWTYLLEQKRRFDPWLENDDPAIVANALIVLVQRANSLIAKQLESLETAFVENGGIRERMTQARLVAKDKESPDCPQCGNAMRKRNSQKGEFWGCSAYPDCRGTRSA